MRDGYSLRVSGWGVWPFRRWTWMVVDEGRDEVVADGHAANRATCIAVGQVAVQMFEEVERREQARTVVPMQARRRRRLRPPPPDPDPRV